MSAPIVAEQYTVGNYNGLGGNTGQKQHTLGT